MFSTVVFVVARLILNSMFWMRFARARKNPLKCKSFWCLFILPLYFIYIFVLDCVPMVGCDALTASPGLFRLHNKNSNKKDAIIPLWFDKRGVHYGAPGARNVDGLRFCFRLRGRPSRSFVQSLLFFSQCRSLNHWNCSLESSSTFLFSSFVTLCFALFTITKKVRVFFFVPEEIERCTSFSPCRQSPRPLLCSMNEPVYDDGVMPPAGWRRSVFLLPGKLAGMQLQRVFDSCVLLSVYYVTNAATRWPLFRGIPPALPRLVAVSILSSIFSVQ